MVILSHFVSYILECNNMSICNLIIEKAVNQTPKYLKTVQAYEIIIIYRNTKRRPRMGEHTRCFA